MSFGAPAIARVLRHLGRRWLVALLIGAALIAGAVASRLRAHHRHAPPPPPDICIYPAQPTPPPAPPPPAPPTSPTAAPGPDVWSLLDRCLHTDPAGRWPSGVTVADVRRWVQVDHDPAWLEAPAWWLPMSGEGDAQMPSGSYIIVPLDGSPCGGAIVN